MIKGHDKAIKFSLANVPMCVRIYAVFELLIWFLRFFQMEYIRQFATAIRMNVATKCNVLGWISVGCTDLRIPSI